jgi:RNA polymerase sigma factor (sigma-70 family)
MKNDSQPAASSQQPAASSQQPAVIIASGMSFYKNWRRECKRMVNSLCPHFPNSSKEDAEDALEAAIELRLKKGLIFEKIEEESAWLFAGAYYCLKNDRRKNRRRAPISDAIQIGCEDETIQAFENRDLIGAVFEILTDEDRELLLKKYRDGIPIPEIAKSEGSTTSKLQKRAQRAIEKVREKAKNL